MAERIDMTEVDGVLYRPEDVERARARAEGRPAVAAAPDMLDIDGVLYRPEDAKRLGLVEADEDDADEAEPEVEHRMVEVDGTQYRIADAIAAGLVELDGSPKVPAEDEADEAEPEDTNHDGDAVITSATAQGADDDGQPDAAGGPEQADKPAEGRKRQRSRK